MWNLPASWAAALFGCQYSSVLVLRIYPVAVLSLLSLSVYTDSDQRKSLWLPLWLNNHCAWACTHTNARAHEHTYTQVLPQAAASSVRHRKEIISFLKSLMGLSVGAQQTQRRTWGGGQILDWPVGNTQYQHNSSVISNRVCSGLMWMMEKVNKGGSSNIIYSQARRLMATA